MVNLKDYVDINLAMALHQLIYISQARRPMSQLQMEQIASLSARNNAGRNISGALLCVGTNFLQLLEGEPDAVRMLYEKISLDPRHVDVAELVFKPINRRLFPEWGMRLLELDSKAALDRKRVTRLCDEFRQHRDTGRYAVEARVLMDDFRRQLIDSA